MDAPYSSTGSSTGRDTVGDDLTSPARLARSILSCPTEVEFVIDGVSHPLADDTDLPLQDHAGVPTFSCTPNGALARAGQEGRPVVVTVRSAMRSAEMDLRGTQLALAGRLRSTGPEYCECCDEVRDRLVIDLEMIRLRECADLDSELGRTASGSAEARRTDIAVEAFLDPAHHLNPGYLQRAVDHANHSHQEELRRAVAGRTNSRLRHVVGVRLANLTARSVEVQWITADGGNRTVVRFPSPATTPEQLGEALRRALHPGLC
ncbi:MAG: hypothetical protein QM638_18985 [Nocardioides sp.]|uniref:hypothetical protein n=1 Tax=Nocardioides sp. TaxID=35761 RepID=UPI0039E570F5